MPLIRRPAEHEPDEKMKEDRIIQDAKRKDADKVVTGWEFGRRSTRHEKDWFSSRGASRAGAGALPAAAAAHRETERAQAELLDLARRATDAHIAALPAAHQPIVRMLRQAANAPPPETR